MSNLKKTTNDIKSKLSFSDYSKPASKQDAKKVKQPTSIPASKQGAKLAKEATGKPVQQHTVTPAVQQPSGYKTKVTYYLGKQEKKMLTDMYIDRLKKHGKADRSALICEAIRLLYEQEK